MISLALGKTWDLTLDGSGNLAVVDGAARTAQDVAAAVRTFKGECLYDVDRGLPYFARVLGASPSLPLLRQLTADEAGIVPGVASARAELLAVENRMLTGRIRITDETGENADVEF